ncbi:hypothetical protein [Halorhodospira halophila]|uniref:hypothetical protein n=1 Tax=Halorhodospira halophila TaxID=1053 RepID=UPI00191175C4|nr:hypothetical protein [Halorhodospira halophila]MBK5944833.1 hypothetical protein [Halorhodospira halophila]
MKTYTAHFSDYDGNPATMQFQADLTEASSPVWINWHGDGFEPTVFQTADARHDTLELARLLFENAGETPPKDLRVEEGVEREV